VTHAMLRRLTSWRCIIIIIIIINWFEGRWHFQFQLLPLFISEFNSENIW